MATEAIPSAALLIFYVFLISKWRQQIALFLWYSGKAKEVAL